MFRSKLQALEGVPQIVSASLFGISALLLQPVASVAESSPLSAMSLEEIGYLETFVQQLSSSQMEAFHVAFYAPAPFLNAPILDTDEIVEKITVKNGSPSPVVVRFESYRFPDASAKKLGELKIPAGEKRTIFVPKVKRGDVIQDFSFPDNPKALPGWTLEEKPTFDRSLFNLLLNARRPKSFSSPE